MCYTISNAANALRDRLAAAYFATGGHWSVYKGAIRGRQNGNPGSGESGAWVSS